MSLFGLLSVSASGLTAQRARAEAAVENLANSEATITASGGPYQRKDVVFVSEPQPSPFSAVFQAGAGQGAVGVSVAEVVQGLKPPVMRYEPGHPQADARGYVAYPNVDPAQEMADLMGASRGYQANVSAMTAVKDMVAKSIDLLR